MKHALSLTFIQQIDEHAAHICYDSFTFNNFINLLKSIVMHNNLQIMPGVGERFLLVQDLPETYVAPEIDVIDIETEQTFLASTGGNGGDMDGELW
jgi:hypothetical protein